MRKAFKLGIGLITLVAIGCGTNDTETINTAPSVNLNTITFNDNSNTISGTITTSDKEDGKPTITEFYIETESNTKLNIPHTNGTVNYTPTQVGIYTSAIVSVKDRDGETTTIEKNIVFEIEAPNLAPTYTITPEISFETGIATFTVQAADPEDADLIITGSIDGKDLSASDSQKNFRKFITEKLAPGEHVFAFKIVDGEHVITENKEFTIEDLGPQEIAPDNYSDETKELYAQTTNIKYLNQTKISTAEPQEFEATTNLILMDDGTEARLITEFEGMVHADGSKTQVAYAIEDGKVQYKFLADVLTEWQNTDITNDISIGTAGTENISNAIGGDKIVKEFRRLSYSQFQNNDGYEINSVALNKVLEQIADAYGTDQNYFVGSPKGLDKHQRTLMALYLLELNMAHTDISDADTVLKAGILANTKAELQSQVKNTEEMYRTMSDWYLENRWNAQ